MQLNDMKKKIVFTVLALLCFAVSAPFSLSVPFAQAEPPIADNGLPVKINADDMEYDIDKNRVIFKGNVHVVRGDFNMTAPKMTIYIKSTKTGQAEKAEVNVHHDALPLTGKVTTDKKTVDTQNKIDRIEAENGVKFKYGTQSGHSHSATYEAGKGILTMKGDPVVEEGNNSIRGETILYYLYERKSEVVGSSKKRVEAIFESNQ